MSIISSTPCDGSLRAVFAYLLPLHSRALGSWTTATAIAGRKSVRASGIAVGGADILLSPLPAAWVVGVADDLLNGIINIDLGVPQLNLTVAAAPPKLHPDGRTASQCCPS